MECKNCDGNRRIEGICGHCNGSGEGMSDGSHCRSCRGSGCQYDECEVCNGTGDVEPVCTDCDNELTELEYENSIDENNLCTECRISYNKFMDERTASEKIELAKIKGITPIEYPFNSTLSNGEIYPMKFKEVYERLTEIRFRYPRR